MKILCKALLLGAAIGWCGHAQAVELASKNKAKELAEDVMKDVVTGKVESAMKTLKIYATVPPEEFDKIEEEIKFQLPGMEKRFGATTGVEFMGDHEAGKSLYALDYLQKFEKHAVRWRFVFYRPRSTGWLLNSFATDDNLSLMFQQ